MAAETEQRVSDWRAELRGAVAAIPHKWLFGLLLLAWVLLFQFLGNSTHGYVKTPSLFGWLSYVYEMGVDDRHGYLIPFVVLGFLWWKRRELAEVSARPWAPALAVLLVGMLIHLLGYMVQQTRLSVVGFYFGLWGILGVVWGPQVMQRTFFPFLLFVFCVPLGTATETLTFPLRKVATTITVKICNLLSIGVQQSGTNMMDPQGRYQYDVAAACSGIRSLTAICAISTAYAFVFFTQLWKRAVVILLAIPLAVISNVLRLLSIVFASELSGVTGHSPQAAGQYVHDSTIISLLPYVVGFFGLFFAARRMREDREVDLRDVALPVGILALIPAIVGEVLRSSSSLPGQQFAQHGPMQFVLLAPFAAVVLIAIGSGRGPKMIFSPRAVGPAAAALVMVGVAAGFLVQRQKWQRLSSPGVKVVPEEVFIAAGTNQFLAATNAVYLPNRVLGYDSRPLPLQQIVWDWLPKDTTYGQRRYFREDGFWLDNMVVLMGADRTSIHKPQFCLTGQGFRIVSEETDSIEVARPVPYQLPVKKLTLAGQVQQDGRRQDVGGVFVYWFVSEDNLSAEHGERMWRMSYDLVRTGVLERWAYVICMAFNRPGEEDVTYERLKEFIRASVPEYQLTTGRPRPELPRAQAGK